MEQNSYNTQVKVWFWIAINPAFAFSKRVFYSFFYFFLLFAFVDFKRLTFIDINCICNVYMLYIYRLHIKID